MTVTEKTFQAAVECWRDNDCEVATRFNTYWRNGEPAPISYVRAQHGVLNDDCIQTLKEICDLLEADADQRATDQAKLFVVESDAEKSKQVKVTREDEENEQRKTEFARQLVSVTAGLLNGVLAASCLRNWNRESEKPFPEAAKQALERCFRHYHDAWNLITPELPLDKARHAAAKPHPDRATDILDEFRNSLGDLPPEWWTESNWLLVRRLISYLLGGEDSSPEWEPNIVQMLLVTKDSVDGYKGLTAPVTTGAYQEGWPSAYLDPVALGVTVLDEEMLTSLRLAARLCRPDLKQSEPKVSLRIGPQATGKDRPFSALSGPSAGGIVTIATCATAKGPSSRLDRDVSASFTVGLRNRKRSTTTSPPGGQALTGDSQKAGAPPSPGTMSLEELNTFLIDVTNSPSPEEIVFGPVNSASIEAKLLAASTAKKPLVTVYLHRDQKSGAKNHEEDWDDWVPRLEHAPTFRIRSVGERNPNVPQNTSSDQAGPSLFDLIHEMSGNERIEHCVRTVAEHAVADWEKMRSGKAPDAGENHHLDIFIPPGITIDAFDEDLPRERAQFPSWAVVRRQKDGGDQKAKQRTPKRRRFHLKRGVLTLLKTFLLEKNRRIALTEDAGAGKTVLSWWIRSLLSQLTSPFNQNGRGPFLVLRYEGDLPEDLWFGLEAAVKSTATKDPNAREVVNFLLQQRRVVIILDAFDQSSAKTVRRLEHLNRLGSEHELSKLRWIVTSRSHAVAERRSNLFRDWQIAKVRLFGPKRRYAYREQFFQQNERHSDLWNQLIPDDSDVLDLLRFPVVLMMIRQIVQNSVHRRLPLAAIKNRGDLYFRITRLLIDRAFKKTGRTKRSTDTPRLIEAMACFGIEMMLTTRDQYQFHVPSGLVPLVIGGAHRRFSGTPKEWSRCLRLLRDTHFTDRSLLFAETGTEPELSFRSLKMLEFAAGVYLARFAPTTIQSELEPHIGRASWDWPFRFALQLPQIPQPDVAHAFQMKALASSLRSLFGRPLGHPRPTELMYLATRFFQASPNGSGSWNDILTEYRQQFRDVVSGTELEPARRAAEVLWEEDVRSLVNEGKTGKWTFANLLPDADNYPAYQLCHDRDNPDHLTFLMGASECDEHAYDTEKPQQSVRIPSFYMATGCVTRAQYRIFDPEREGQHLKEIDAIAPDEDCPMIYVNFYDVFCFAQWLGDDYRLPTEVEWEGAAWGGMDRRSPEHMRSVIGVPGTSGVPPYDSFTTAQVNFDGNYPLSGEKSAYLERTLPIRWDQERRASGLMGLQLDALPNAYNKNGFGLWHMSGNVWEWCGSRWIQSLAEAIEDDNASKPGGLGNDYVCVRGGSWYDDARFTRCSCRLRYAPDYRGINLGFRLTRTK